MIKQLAKQSWVVVILFIAGCTVLSSLQKRRLITVFHLIETAKYTDAKALIEEMITDQESMSWPRTWYARGLLCQKAYAEGIKKKDKKLYELYPDQLYVAYESYERALSLDKTEKTARLLREHYVELINDFQKTGEQHYNAKRYTASLRSYEHALRINLSPVISARVDTGIIHNAGLAAYEAGDTDKAIRYLGRLHNHKYSSNVTHLLYLTYLNNRDTAMAGQVLAQGVVHFSYPDTLVLLLVDLLQHAGLADSALRVLDRAIALDDSSFSFQYTKGLVLQKGGEYQRALKVYLRANELNPSDPWVALNIATCYYNLGIGIEEQARRLTERSAVLSEREKAAKAYNESRHWVQRTYALKPSDPQINNRLNRLSDALPLR